MMGKNSVFFRKFFHDNEFRVVCDCIFSIPLIDFPCCVIGEPPELTAENLVSLLKLI